MAVRPRRMRKEERRLPRPGNRDPQWKPPCQGDRDGVAEVGYQPNVIEHEGWTTRQLEGRWKAGRRFYCGTSEEALHEECSPSAVQHLFAPTTTVEMVERLLQE
ncbi:hypothetical protein B296_00030940 [Ensete ventricosum]|uniref:Uncharacterized protein n=1 Tax=Ensete ventricosum TaxID=4639 RepID=A0A427AHP4_ENSVE|nr:hypothetical protein B296_00030940 [Ensete ventricosum]